MLYLDANIFVYAAINTEQPGDKARSLLRKIHLGEEIAETSALTFDEVFWSIKKDNLKMAFSVCEAMLNFPHLEIVPVNRTLALSALKVIRDFHLAPRDAIHAATAIAGKAESIVSEDSDFARVKGIKWQNPFIV